MADISLIQDDPLDDSDEGVFEQGDNGHLDYQSDPLLRIEKCGFSESDYDRQAVPKILVEIFTIGQVDSLSKQLSLIMKTVMDVYNDSNSNVKADFLDNIPNLTTTSIECSNRIPELSSLLGDYFLPLVVRSLGIKSNQIRKSAQRSLFTLFEKGYISRQQAEIQICPTVLALSNMQNPADCDSIAVTLMSKLAPFLGRDVTERIFLERFSELCTSNLFYVRKICASNFGDFCAVIGTEAYERILLPSYLSLCKDDNWGVRKSCAEVVLSVSCACPPLKRRSTLAPVFVRLLKDESRWVRMSAYQALGPFISTFADPIVTSLGYSNLGELVLINSDGTEFKITPTYSETNIIRVTGDLQMLMCQEKRKIDLGDGFFIEYGACNDIDMFGERSSSSNNVVDKDFLTKSDNNANEMNNEQEYSDFLEYHDDIVLDESSKLNELNLPNKENNSSLNVVNQSVLNITNEANRKNEDLEKYNSYNYWYVSPDIPLDPIIVCGKLSEQRDNQNPHDSKNRHDDEQVHSTIYEDIFDSRSSAFPLIPVTAVSDLSLCDNATPNTCNREVSEEQIVVEEEEETLTSITEPSQYIVPQLLIDHFVSMTDPMLASNTDNEMAYHCAYSLPAVALTLGSNNWHLLKETVENLAGNMQYKVRRTVASSLHELAIILGQDIATNYLTPIFEGFLKDLDEVRIGVLRHLAHFLKLISPLKRSGYLPRLAEFLQSDNEANWRFRQELAEQLLLAVPLFHPVDATKYLSALAQELLCDKVAAVRQVALLLVAELIRYVSPDKTLSSRLLFKLAEKFAHSTRWKQRQTFALLCSHLLINRALPPEVFASEVMPHLLDLSWDPVPNVRLVVARTISQHIITNEYFLDINNQHDGLESVLRRLKSDKDRDVRQCATVEECTSLQY